MRNPRQDQVVSEPPPVLALYIDVSTAVRHSQSMQVCARSFSNTCCGIATGDGMQTEVQIKVLTPDKDMDGQDPRPQRGVSISALPDLGGPLREARQSKHEPGLLLSYATLRHLWSASPDVTRLARIASQLWTTIRLGFSTRQMISSY